MSFRREHSKAGTPPQYGRLDRVKQDYNFGHDLKGLKPTQPNEKPPEAGQAGGEGARVRLG